MLVVYDPWLVFLSIMIAACGSYTCFHLAEHLTTLTGGMWKGALVGAAVSIGGGIWAMHFVGMLAIDLPVTLTYDIFGTVVSFLIALMFTAAALYIVSFWTMSASRIMAGGALLGTGIAFMHYVGMGAIRANCIILYNKPIVVLSVVIGIVVSMVAIYLAYRVTSRWKQPFAAGAMGIGISGVHYTGMLAATFVPTEEILLISQPSLGNGTLAIVISVIAFIIFGMTFAMALPAPHEEEGSEAQDIAFNPSLLRQSKRQAAAQQKKSQAGENKFATIEMDRVPVQVDRKTVFVDPKEIVCIDADSHYAKVYTQDREYFTNLSISELEKRLPTLAFLRVHRSHIVNMHSILSFNRAKNQGSLMVNALGEDRLVPVSRSKIRQIKVALGLK